MPQFQTNSLTNILHNSINFENLAKQNNSGKFITKKKNKHQNL